MWGLVEKLNRGARRALGLHHPGRNLDVFPDDVFLVSYPKSGNTWTRFLVANLAYPATPANFFTINTLIPDPEALSKRELSRMPVGQEGTPGEWMAVGKGLPGAFLSPGVFEGRRFLRTSSL